MTALRITSLWIFTLFLVACSTNKVVITETQPKPSLPELLKTAPAPPPASLITGNFSCEGKPVKLIVNAAGNYDLHWNKRVYSMQAVPTTTGALRLEDKLNGLAWIQIPTKSMLLNSKLGQPLANECKSL